MQTLRLNDRANCAEQCGAYSTTKRIADYGTKKTKRCCGNNNRDNSYSDCGVTTSFFFSETKIKRLTLTMRRVLKRGPKKKTRLRDTKFTKELQSWLPKRLSQNSVFLPMIKKGIFIVAF